MSISEKAGRKAEGKLDKDFIEELAYLVTKADLSEIEVEHKDMRIRVSRTIIQQTIPVQMQQPTMPQAVNTNQSVCVAEQPVLDKPENIVKSPMVGTVYLSPDPNSPSFVKVGDKVEAGQTLLIIEAMKVMNNIPSPKAGKIKQILVSDKQPVEYDQSIIILE